MRRRQTYAALMLCVAVSCSSFASQRVRQYNAVITEAYKQTAIYLDAGKLKADDGAAIIAALDLASKQVDRYWAAVRDDSPQDVRKVILKALEEALAEAQKILLAREASK
ncbi:MAG: hypothetical protein ACR2RE_15970 [Geminicoccaceae bacterium]